MLISADASADGLPVIDAAPRSAEYSRYRLSARINRNEITIDDATNVPKEAVIAASMVIDAIQGN